MKQVPRYTSYPTAPHFHEGVSGDMYDSWLGELDKQQNLSIYIHIPFCAQLCWFCGCHTQVINQYDHVKRYLALLEIEIELISRTLGASKLGHIHFGGGSPTILSGADFSAILKSLCDRFTLLEGAEIAIEIDPRTVDKVKISSYAKSGVTRASLGVQDFNELVQQVINRPQSFELVRDVIAQLRDQGIRDLNIDLVYGLPHQTLTSITDTLKRTLSLLPDRVSLFGYAHVPWMKKHQKLIPEANLPDAELRRDMFELAADLMKREGYVAIGLDHFARPGDSLSQALQQGILRRNFQGYSTDKAEALIGLGVSSISSLPHGYAQNTANHKEYAQSLAAGKLPIVRGVELSQEDKNRREIIMSLMCLMRADIPKDLYQQELARLTPFISRGEARYEDHTLIISPEARSKMRLIASVFDTYLPGTTHLHAQAV